MWDRFVKTGRAVRSTISIWPRGVISLNAKANRECGIDGETFVVLYYARAEHCLGFRFVSNRDEVGAMRLSRAGAGSVISARSFLTTYGLTQSSPVKIPLQWNDKENLWVAEVPHHLASKERP